MGAEKWIAVAVSAAVFIFNAGVTYALLIQNRKDTDGIGKKLGGMEKDLQDDRTAIFAMLELICPEKHRAALTGLLIGARRR